MQTKKDHLKDTAIILLSAAVMFFVFFRNQDSTIDSHFQEAPELMKKNWTGGPYEIDTTYRDAYILRFTSGGKYYFIDYSNDRKIYSRQGVKS